MTEKVAKNTTKNGKRQDRDNTQAKAMSALLTGKNQAEAAQDAGVHVRTLQRWLAEDAIFIASLRAAEADAVNVAARGLAGLAGDAVSTLREVLTTVSYHPAVRLKAAGDVLGNLLKLRELVTLEERIAAIEEAIQNGDTE